MSVTNLFRPSMRAISYILVVLLVITIGKLLVDFKLTKEHSNKHVPATENALRNVVSSVEDLPPVSGYAVYTPTCRIVDVDPWHSTIKQFVHKEDKPLVCMNYQKLATLENGLLSPTDALIKKGSGQKCHYEAVSRGFVESDDNKWSYGKVSELPLKKGSVVNVTDDFIHIFCDKGKDRVYDDFLTQTHLSNFHSHKKDMNLRPAPKTGGIPKQRKLDEKLNVLMVGIDSMSRPNGHRQLTKLRDFILNKLNGIELNGYNRVGDNTFLNMCPLLMGKTIEETKWDANKFFDDEPFVWKRFMANGYASLYAEDATDGAALNYLKRGFSKFPSHHYYRHMSLAIEKSTLYKKSPKWCCGRKGLHRWILDYAKQFATTYHTAKTPFFGLTFSTIISHDDINAVGKTDAEYADFLRVMNDTNILNNTVVIVFGDHGYRFGGIRSTYVGRYAENLPMLYMAFPKWFKKKYSTYDSALRRNQHRLTTAFDVHQTIRELCTDCAFPQPSDYGSSLFESIPINRSCADAGIPIHYCACREEKKLSVDDANVVQASKALLNRINELNNKKKGLCLVQSITAILGASTSVHDKTYSKGCTVKNVCYDSNWHNIKTSFTLYLVTIQTQPGTGQFQASVRQENNKFEVMGDISRINLYGNTSSCITDDFNLRKFCYCKGNI